MSDVNVGDRVRATCGESVVVGTVVSVNTNGPYVVPESGDFSLWLYIGDWTVEVLAPLIPDVVGTIVRDGDGDAWQRFEDGWYSTATVARSDPLALPKLQRQYGPLTVLWTPEATS